MQTESSTLGRPHILGHLFHGGAVLASRRVDFEPGLALTRVRRLMQRCHCAMLRALRRGEFDREIRAVLGELVVVEPVPVDVVSLRDRRLCDEAKARIGGLSWSGVLDTYAGELVAASASDTSSLEVEPDSATALCGLALAHRHALIQMGLEPAFEDVASTLGSSVLLLWTLAPNRMFALVLDTGSSNLAMARRIVRDLVREHEDSQAQTPNG